MKQKILMKFGMRNPNFGPQTLWFIIYGWIKKIEFRTIIRLCIAMHLAEDHHKNDAFKGEDNRNDQQ